MLQFLHSLCKLQFLSVRLIFAYLLIQVVEQQIVDEFFQVSVDIFNFFNEEMNELCFVST